MVELPPFLGVDQGFLAEYWLSFASNAATIRPMSSLLRLQVPGMKIIP